MRRWGVRVAVSTSLVAAAFALAACTGGGDDGAQPSSAGGADTTIAAAATSGVAVDTDESGAPDPTAPTVTRATVPELGVPGLDSTDAFCRAWSRFGGSFQVVAVAAAFGEGGPDAAAAIEVAAAPTVSAAYDDLLAAWPDELDAERDVVADDYLGPFAERARRALDALVAAGATDADVAAIAQAWEAALQARDPASPAVDIALDERLELLVTTAAADVAASEPPIPEDPDLVVTASTPATDAYIESTCPDQGTLAGEPTG
jgi:hypothetical protein